jgi:hypothetical protein
MRRPLVVDPIRPPVEDAVVVTPAVVWHSRYRRCGLEVRARCLSTWVRTALDASLAPLVGPVGRRLCLGPPLLRHWP